MLVLSLQHAGSRADCCFTLRASLRRSYGTEQLVVHVWLATFLGVGCSLKMCLEATRLRACEDEEASVDGVVPSGETDLSRAPQAGEACFTLLLMVEPSRKMLLPRQQRTTL